MPKYGMKVDRNFNVTITEVVDDAPVFIHNDKAYWAAVDALDAGDPEPMKQWKRDNEGNV